MAAAIPVQIGKWAFPTKDSARAKCREIWAKYPGREMVPVTDSKHVEFIQALLAEHPQVEEKTSKEIAGFSVGTNKGGTRCFYINYVDETWDDFSHESCINAAAKRQNDS
jgi:hypothetical protein